MLTDKQILDNLSLIIIEKDQNGNIIRPTNKDDLEKCCELLQNVVEINDEYYDRKNNKWYKVQKVTLLDETDNTLHEVTYLNDITIHKIREKNAFKDEVTSLYNRSLTNKLVNDYISFAKEEKEEFSIMLCDLDEFKSANDSYGHLFGDMLLRRISNVLLDETSTTDEKRDIVGRFGGDEFFILFKNIDQKSSINRANQIKNRIQQLNITYDGKKIKTPTVSIGIYHVSIDELSNITDADNYRDVIYKKADTALYNSKNSGKNQVTYYTKELNREKTKSIIKKLPIRNKI